VSFRFVGEWMRTGPFRDELAMRHWTSHSRCDIYFQLLNSTFIACIPELDGVGFMAGTIREYNITSLQRGLRMLQLLGQTDRGLPASQIAKLSGLPVSTVHRFLVNLESGSFLMRDNVGNYHLGVACVFLGQAAREQLDIRTVSLPHLQQLNYRTRETVHLTVRHGLSAVYIEKLDSPQPLRIHSKIGASVPLHCSAVGKVLLAYMNDGDRERHLSQMELRRFTENTVGSIQELQTELARVRKNGYGCDLEEHEPHVRCIAAPVWDHSGAVNASLSVTGPAVRMSTARLREIAPLVRQAGLEISRELGYKSEVARAIAPVHSGSPYKRREPQTARRAKVAGK
jgi:IclR family transcriptional regulator, KDG regulon repressor